MSTEIIGLPELHRKLSLLEKQVFPRAATRAINRVATMLKTETKRDVAKHMGLPQKVVNTRLALRKAKESIEPTASLVVKGKAFNLIEFKATQLKKGVKAAPWGKRRLFLGSFIATINGQKLVMIRQRKAGGGIGTGATADSKQAAAIAMQQGGSRREGRLPIRAMLGPGVAKTAAEESITKKREEFMREKLPERLQHELSYLVSRLR